VWTVGCGETKGVKQGDLTTPQRALMVLGESVNGYAKGIQSCVTAPLYQYEFDALVDAAYNAGTAAVCKSPMVARFNLQDYEGACLAFKNWYIRDKKGNVLKGLINRRENEYQTCIGAKQ
jgi:lysozyme